MWRLIKEPPLVSVVCQTLFCKIKLNVGTLWGMTSLVFGLHSPAWNSLQRLNITEFFSGNSTAWGDIDREWSRRQGCEERFNWKINNSNAYSCESPSDVAKQADRLNIIALVWTKKGNCRLRCNWQEQECCAKISTEGSESWLIPNRWQTISSARKARKTAAATVSKALSSLSLENIDSGGNVILTTTHTNPNGLTIVLSSCYPLGPFYIDLIACLAFIPFQKLSFAVICFPANQRM